MSRFAKNFHLTCAIIASLTCIVWLAVVGLVLYWHPTSPRLDPAKIAFVLVPALVVGLGALMEFSFYNNERKGKAPLEDESLPGSGGQRLLTSRLRILVAMGATGLLLALAIRGIVYGHPKAQWIISPSPMLHGWLLLVANMLFYCYVCWIGFWFIRNTTGRERVFAVGWCLGFFLWPLRILWPQVAVPIRHIDALGLVTAMFAALALLLEPAGVNHSGDTTDAA